MKNILVTGANRGLGKEIARQLLGALSKDESLYVSTRSIEKSREFIVEAKKNYPNASERLHLFELDLEQKEQKKMFELAGELPSFNYIFHVASPYIQTLLLKASPEEFLNFMTCERNETLFLCNFAKKLEKNGCLLATGAIIGRVIAGENISMEHPWYIGLSSHQKAVLSATMAALFQEMPNHRIIHANIGAFRDGREDKSFEEQIKKFEVLSTQDLASRLIRLARSSEKLAGFNIDFVTKMESQEMEKSHIKICPAEVIEERQKKSVPSLSNNKSILIQGGSGQSKAVEVEPPHP